MKRPVPAALLLWLSSATPSSAQEAREEALLQHPTPGELDPAGYSDAFGDDVDISADGTRVVVGAPNDDTTDGANAGTAYVFVRVGTAWSREATLAPGGIGPAANQQFGIAVAMASDGSRIVVGRPGADAVAGGNPEGGVDVFVREDTGWRHEAFLGGLEPLERFGVALDLSDDGATLVVGAPGTTHQGDARIFTRSGATWTLAQDLVPPELGFFGAQVAISGDASRIAISIPTGDSGPGGTNSGGARVYRQMGATWVEEQALYASFAVVAESCFDALAFDRAGTRLLGGCALDGPGAMPHLGAVAAFVRTGTSWTEEAMLRAEGAMRDDYFGASIALVPDGSRAVIGAYGDTTFPVPGVHGSVRVFDRVGSSWSEIAIATTPMLEGGPSLGVSVAIVDDGARFVAGAPGDGAAGDAFFTSARVFTFGEPPIPDAGMATSDAAIDVDAGTAPTLDGAIAIDAASTTTDAASVSMADAPSVGDAGAPPLSSSGCGCAVPASRGASRHAGLLALALAAMVLARRQGRRRTRVLAALFVASLSLAGCGGGEDTLDAGPTGTPDAHVDPSIDARDPSADAARTETTRTTIGAAGGTARSADGLFEIIVAAGALTEDTEISITPVATAEVPSDISATDPISTVYAVEPDGLTFGGDGAIVHYHFDTTPGVLVRDGRFGAGFPVSRSASGGTPEWQAEPTTLHHGGVVDVLSSLAHLSYQWASERDAFGDDYFLGVVYRDDRERGVGDRWSPVTDAQATTELGSIQFTRVAVGAVGVLGGSPLPAEPTVLEQVARRLLGVGEDPLEDNNFTLPDEPFRADLPQLLPSDAMPYVCREAGVGRLFDRVRLQRTVPATERVYLHVEDPEPTRCFGPEGVGVSILDTIPAVREDATITTSTPPAAEARVETRGEGTRTVNLADSPWFVILEPAAAPPPPGPTTITATNNGATMTATRDPMTGEYDALVDDPALWDADTLTRVLFGSGTSLDVMPTPPLAVEFGAVDGLDTSVTPGRDTRLSVLFPGELRCGLEDVVDMELFRSIVDDLPLDGVLRDALSRLASHCETTIAALTGRPFTVEVSRQEQVYVEMPGVGGLVSVGRAVSLNGEDLLAMCGGRLSTFCRDRCIDTAGDPMNCGGCGVVGVETCDGTDDDCDGYVDNGCPTTIVWPSSTSETSPLIGDTTSASTGTGSTRGAAFNPYIGLCGTTNTDGTIRTMVAMLGTLALRRTGTDTFALDLVPADNTLCSDTTRPPSGGTTFSAECPAGMIAEGVSGQAPAMGHVGQLTVLCARWGVSRDVTRRWVIRRTESGMSTSAGSGTGMPFTFMPLADATTGNPPALRYLRSTYRSLAPGGMPGGVLWFQVGAVSPTLL